MSVRASLLQATRFLRQYGNASNTDVFEGVTYWSDDQLEAILDTLGKRVRVRLNASTSDNTTFVIDLPRHYRLDTATLVVYTSGGTVVSTSYTLEQGRGELVFTEVLANDYYYVEVLAINMWEALAELWEQKANQRVHYIDFKAGSNKVNLQQEYTHCVDRGRYYRNKTIKRHRRKWRP